MCGGVVVTLAAVLPLAAAFTGTFKRPVHAASRAGTCVASGDLSDVFWAAKRSTVAAEGSGWSAMLAELQEREEVLVEELEAAQSQIRALAAGTPSPVLGASQEAAALAANNSSREAATREQAGARMGAVIGAGASNAAMGRDKRVRGAPGIGGIAGAPTSLHVKGVGGRPAAVAGRHAAAATPPTSQGATPSSVIPPVRIGR